jgi:tRNA U34 5-methylaminomethyl-2-thiouridine-forming methyltransferase MnmC
VDFIIITKIFNMQLVITGDGSHTLFVPGINEHYHSTFGAYTESMHVFIKAGLECFAAKEHVTVFEVGFGTGLNALLTCLAAMKERKNIIYYALEKNPVDNEVVTRLNFMAYLSPDPDHQQLFMNLHQAPWNTTSIINQSFQIHKIHSSLIGFQPDFNYDLIFFDAFAPEKQPEMWTQEIFNRLYLNLNTGGILTTYCVKGTVKRMLKEAGFVIEKLPGPKGKREMLRGKKEY